MCIRDSFEDCPLVDGYYLVCHPEHLEETRALIPAEGYPKLRRMVPGGATRQASCHRGLAAMLEECDSQDVVLVHDAARPLVTGETLIRCARTAETCGAANTVYPSAVSYTHLDVYKRQLLFSIQIMKPILLMSLCVLVLLRDEN